MLRVLIDADNVAPRRMQPVLELLGRVTGPVRLTASGSGQALARMSWPDGTELLAQTGWQQADLALAQSYRPDDQPLVLISGDGDFGLLAARHPGPVLVVSGAPSSRLRASATIVDPALEGTTPIRSWLAAHGLGVADDQAEPESAAIPRRAGRRGQDRKSDRAQQD